MADRGVEQLKGPAAMPTSLDQNFRAAVSEKGESIAWPKESHQEGR
jgi:hypothetical protein